MELFLTLTQANILFVRLQTVRKLHGCISNWGRKSALYQFNCRIFQGMTQQFAFFSVKNTLKYQLFRRNGSARFWKDFVTENCMFENTGYKSKLTFGLSFVTFDVQRTFDTAAFRSFGIFTRERARSLQSTLVCL